MLEHSKIFMKNTIKIILIVICFSTQFNLWSQKKSGVFGDLFKKKTEIRSTKYGPYIGLQKGKYTFFELGAEYQWKKIKLIKPTTNALHLGFDYNFTQNQLGWNLGYWRKMGRLDLTYGLNLNYKTDFTTNRFGVSPVMGFKLFQFHLQAGVMILDKRNTFITNSVFISLRWVLIKNRDINVVRKKR